MHNDLVIDRQGGATMAEQEHRHCLNRLISITGLAEGMDHRQLAAAVDEALACNGRRACSSHLACSWLAADLAASLAKRYR